MARIMRPRIIEGDGTITGAGSVGVGTPDFTAPEMALDPHKADIRSDLYSLGHTFYYPMFGISLAGPHKK